MLKSNCASIVLEFQYCMNSPLVILDVIFCVRALSREKAHIILPMFLIYSVFTRPNRFQPASFNQIYGNFSTRCHCRPNRERPTAIAE